MTQEPTPETDKSWSERWGASHNERRQEQYTNDEVYRQQRLEQSRESYRAKTGLTLFSCLDRLPLLDAYGHPRVVNLDGVTHTDRLCFTMGEFAEIIGDHKAPVVYRWRSRNLVPDPIAKANVWVDSTGKGGSYWQEQSVYLAEEVAAMMTVIGEHQSRLRYYRTQDVETTAKVFAAMDAARAAL